MNLSYYDPHPYGNEYASRMFIQPLMQFASDRGYSIEHLQSLKDVKNSNVVVLTDHLSDELIVHLKNDNNRIIGINVTDSSYISGAIRYAKHLPLVDIIFMVSGIQVCNDDMDFVLRESMEIEMVPKEFLDEGSWKIFSGMYKNGQLHSLPYVPWERINIPQWTPWHKRSQKALIRGGGHSRRFLLSLFLLLKDKLDPNSGFVLHPYFEDGMNPQFRFCDDCRADYKAHRRARRIAPSDHCTSLAHGSFDSNATYSVADLGQWNNRCPRSFYWLAEQFQKRYGPINMSIVEDMLNARWLHPDQHMAMLGRILFTSDLKWIHSIYQPQRFWEGAAAGCISVLPDRSAKQSTFPQLDAGVNYLCFKETMKEVGFEFAIRPGDYEDMAKRNRQLFDDWIQPSAYKTNTNLLKHMLDLISS